MKQVNTNNKQFKRIAGSLLASLTLALGACSDSGTAANDIDDERVVAAANLASANIVETAVAAGTFNTLAAALQVTGLDAVLSDESRSFTVFAPTDEAFEKLGDDVINALLNDTETLSDILLYHVVPDLAADAATAISLDGQMIAAANGDDLAVNLDGSSLFINDSEVTATDIYATNGIIHVIDTILIPPVDMPENDAPMADLVDTAISAGSFTTLVAALQATGLDETLRSDGPFTVFAPTDDAFALLGDETINALLADPDTLSDILLYHVVAGQAVDAVTAIGLVGNSVESASGDSFALELRDGELFVNDSRVIATDIVTANGIIHVIDAVLIPPSDDTTGTADAPVAVDDGNSMETPQGTILDVARANGFNTLIAAVEAAGLDGALGHPGDTYTVFAPTDAAFAALGSDTINALLADPATLRNILLQHVIPGTVVDSAAAVSLIDFDIQAGNGGTLRITRTEDGLAINGVSIIATDVRAVNGVIHVIDGVLLP